MLLLNPYFNKNNDLTSTLSALTTNIDIYRVTYSIVIHKKQTKEQVIYSEIIDSSHWTKASVCVHSVGAVTLVQRSLSA